MAILTILAGCSWLKPAESSAPTPVPPTATWTPEPTPSPTPTPTLYPERTRFVQVPSARVRGGAGTAFPVTAGLLHGQEVRVVNTSGSWSEIRLAGGKTGWVASALLGDRRPKALPQPTAAPTAIPDGSAPAGPEAGPESEPADEPAAQPTVLPTPDLPPTPLPSPTPAGEPAVVRPTGPNSSVVVRATPAAFGAWVGALEAGEQVFVLQHIDGWVQVRSRVGIGYIQEAELGR